METGQVNNNSVEMRTTQERKLCYRNLLSRIEEIQESEDLSLKAINELGHILHTANLLNKECDITQRVEHADETLLDANVLSAAGSVLVKCVEAVDIYTSTYEPVEFCAKLIDDIQEPEDEEVEPSNFLKLIATARKVISQVPPYSFLYGTYDFTKVPQPKERKQRKKEVQEHVQKKNLTQVTNLEKDEEGVLDVVNFLVKALDEEYTKNDCEPVNYYNFVTDSSSFAITVENIFYCSFVIRDGKAKLNIDGEGNPTLEPMRRKELKRFRNSNGVNTQMITSISMDDWQKSKVKEGIIQRHKRIASDG